MSQLDAFRSFDVNTDIEELIALSLFGRQLAAEYDSLNIEAPEWVTDNAKAIRREIHSRIADAREARIKEISSRLSALESNEEKRAKLEKELERLKAVATP